MFSLIAISFGRLYQRVGGALRALLSFPEYGPPLFFCGLGSLLVFLSLSFGLAFVSLLYPNGTERQVGFLYALNWSANSVVVFPFFVLCMLKAINSAMCLKQMATQRLLLELTPVTTEQVDNKEKRLSDLFALPDLSHLKGLWENRSDVTSKWCFWFCIVIVVFSVREWLVTSAIPLWNNDPVTFQETEKDWSIAAIFPGQPSYRVLNAFFSFLAFLVQAAWFTLFVAFPFALYRAFAFVDELATGDSPWVLIPRPKKATKCLGFEVFREAFESIILAICAFSCFCYLSRLQNVYMNSDHHATNLAEFVYDDILTGIKASPLAVSGPTQDLIKGQSGGVDYSSMMIMFVFLLVLLGIAWAVIRYRTMVRNSQNGFDDLVEKLELRLGKELSKEAIREEFGFVPKSCRDKIQKMEWWPWPLGIPVSAVAVLAVLAFLSIMFYKIGLFFFGILIITVVSWGVKRLVSGSNK